MPDKMKIRILADGTIRVDTDTISEGNHVSAEGFIRLLAERAGGKVEVQSKAPDHHDHDGHSHGHGHGEHQH